MLALIAYVKISSFDAPQFICSIFADPPNLLSSFNKTVENITNTLNLSCTFEGFPKPQIHWYINTTSLKGDEKELNHSKRLTVFYEVDENQNPYSELQLVNFSEGDEGSYRCVGSNGVENLIGAVDHFEAFITVQGKVIILTFTRYSLRAT